MQVVFHCYDNEQLSAELRLSHLQAHLNWVKKNMANISVAGPLVNQQNLQYCGSLYVIEAESVTAAEKVLHQDPYYQAGIWKNIECQEFKAYAGNWVGGENWPQMPQGTSQ